MPSNSTINKFAFTALAAAAGVVAAGYIMASFKSNSVVAKASSGYN